MPNGINTTLYIEVVNKRMEFYNLYNFEKFIERYNDDVKIYTYPDKLLEAGTDKFQLKKER